MQPIQVCILSWRCGRVNACAHKRTWADWPLMRHIHCIPCYNAVDAWNLLCNLWSGMHNTNTKAANAAEAARPAQDTKQPVKHRLPQCWVCNCLQPNNCQPASAPYASDNQKNALAFGECLIGCSAASQAINSTQTRQQCARNRYQADKHGL